MPHMNESLKHFEMFSRNERWGTCVDCPRTTDGKIFPEFCQFTDRLDHQLNIDELARTFKTHAR
jgi:hypothetical protein